LQSGIARRGDTPGWNFQLAIEILQVLSKAETGKNLEVLAKDLRVDDLQLESPLQTLISLDWLGKLDENSNVQGARYVLLIDPAKTLLAPLSERLLLPNQTSTQKIWGESNWTRMHLAEVL
jgi:membrane protein